MLADSVNTEAYVKRLFELIVENFPFIWWHNIELAVISLKLSV